MNSNVDRLENMAWSSASAWDLRARDWLFEYYVRIFPVWPESSPQILPQDPRVIDAFVSRLTDPERASLERRKGELLDAWRSRRREPTTSTKTLLPLLLAAAMLAERGALAPEEDPSVPLLELFGAGYELNPSHGAVDVLYATGMTTVPLPRRSDIEAKRAARGSSKPPAGGGPPPGGPQPPAPTTLWFDTAREHFYLVPSALAPTPGPFELHSNQGQKQLVDLRQVLPFEVSAAEARAFFDRAVDQFFATGAVPTVPPAPDDGSQLFATAKDLLRRLGANGARDQKALFQHLEDLVGAFDARELTDALQRTASKLAEKPGPLRLDRVVDVVQALLDEELAAEPELKPGFADEVRAEARASINAALRRRGFDVDD